MSKYKHNTAINKIRVQPFFSFSILLIHKRSNKKEIGPRGDLRSPSILLQYEFLFHIVMKGICQMEREGMIPKDASREIEQFSVGGWVRIFDYALGGVSTLDGNCKHFEQYDTSYVARKLL